MKTWWSHIDAAVVRMGAHTLEVHGGQDQNQYWIDGVQGNLGTAVGNEFETTMGNVPIHFKWISKQQRRFRIDLGHGDAISIVSSTALFCCSLAAYI